MNRGIDYRLLIKLYTITTQLFIVIDSDEDLAKVKWKKRVQVLFDDDCAVKSKQPVLVKDDDILEATPPTCG